MKPLLTYIEEARETIGKLPFTLDEFELYLHAADECEEESDEYLKVQNAIIDNYGERVWLGFRGWCEGTMYKSDTKDLYEILKNIPKNRLSHILGAGSFGSAIEMSNGYVCKLFHKNTPMTDQDIRFYKWCLSHDSKFFPKVKKLGKNFVIMEKLDVGTKKCQNFAKIIDDWNVNNPISKKYIDAKLPDAKNGPLFCTINVLKSPVKSIEENLVKAISEIEDKNYRWHAQWTYDACCELRDMGIIGGNIGDMKPANIGERKDGAIIWFDI